ncbi:uncharacterized protein LOC26535741 [Drosophila yakuba]|uniref:Uncharacterized protein n=1 Tax=Drosophila yakuba TaxID=7245 RepID=A0A0R1DKZ0_DROYA|nr:uncharacterized protein LOC26535741 [Drosophila yakuba]KRJ97940.1 uncharacterized protein Dyak_GE28560 [Drosophila yakuba]
MERSMIVTRLQARRRRIEGEEKVCIQLSSSMDKVDEMVKLFKRKVDNQLAVIQATTDVRLLQMKWSDFMGMAIAADERSNLMDMAKKAPFKNLNTINNQIQKNQS